MAENFEGQPIVGITRMHRIDVFQDGLWQTYCGYMTADPDRVTMAKDPELAGFPKCRRCEDICA